jgi:3-hydroxyacyl-CoA dehydrogenase
MLYTYSRGVKNIMSSGAHVRKVAILGAGVMGAQIAAHLASADVEVMLFELAAQEGDPNANVDKAIKQLGKMRPAPASAKDRLKLITPANYDQDLDKLRGCDLIIEAIAERMEWKEDLYKKVAPYINDQAIFASNTSGIGITLLSNAMPESIRPRFCGVHFFNPPRYMPLVEVIPGASTDPQILDKLETFLVTTLGKGVVRAKDSPNFIANRLGVFNIQATMYHAERLGLPFDIVDALTGPAVGRPSTATFRTSDLVGLDTLANVLATSARVLTSDPWQKYYHVPTWLQGLIDKGALGNKTRGGIYRQGPKKEKLVLDVAKMDYRPVDNKIDPAVKTILGNKKMGERLAALRASNALQAQFVWAILRDLWHYSAVTLNSIADNARDADFAMRWGYGWKQGPFETWQSAGWKQVAGWIAEDIAAGKTMSDVPLPAWVMEVDGVHSDKGSWAPEGKVYRPRSSLPVYKRQYFPERVLGEAAPNTGETLFENDGVRVWHQGDDVAIVSFKSKMHAVGESVIEGVHKALDIAEDKFAGLVIWQTEPPFSAGADLGGIAPVVMMGDFKRIEGVVKQFQNMTTRLRYSFVPVVAAVQGMALGGGCEIAMHSDRVVAALESYVGLVEIGVGLLPAGGGCKELARRISVAAPDNNLNPFLVKAFQNVATAKVATSAQEAKDMGLFRDGDLVVFNPNEILYVAKAQARAMAESGYRPPLSIPVKVAGRNGVAMLEMGMVNMLEGHFMSEHDYFCARKIAMALCGGDVEPGTEVPESWLLKLECDAFVELIAHPKSQERAMHMLQTGKPLRN